jgi:hypothetical protein
MEEVRIKIIAQRSKGVNQNGRKSQASHIFNARDDVGDDLCRSLRLQLFFLDYLGYVTSSTRTTLLLLTVHSVTKRLFFRSIKEYFENIFYHNFDRIDNQKVARPCPKLVQEEE